MRHINPLKAGWAVGAVLGLWHLIWVTLVGVGWAKPVMDFVLRLHFIKLQYALAPFDFATAATLVILAFAIGTLVGVVFALVWNWLSIENAPTWTGDANRRAPAE
jgi:hypothetical protein